MKLAPGKGTGGGVWRKPDSSPHGVTRTYLIPSALIYDKFGVSSTMEAR